MYTGQGHVLFSSNASNSLKCSGFDVNANNTTSNSDASLGSGILFRQNNAPDACPYQHGKIHYYAPLCVGREIEDSGVTRHEASR
jgi:hypothetical protein